MKYRAMYSYEPDTGLILKIQGTGPNQIKDDMIAELYKLVVVVCYCSIDVKYGSCELLYSIALTLI